MSSSSSSGSAQQQPEQLDVQQIVASLSTLPAALAAVGERQVLSVAANRLAQAYGALGYVRVVLVSQNYQPSELLELCLDQQMAPALATLASGGGGASTTSQQAAMRGGRPVHTPQLQPKSPDYADWRLLQQRFGMQSFAAVPLMVGGTVHGAVVAASATPHCFTARTMAVLEAACHMLAPYSAVLYKHRQIQATRALLDKLLPPRVVAGAVERLAAGGASAVDVFVPSHAGAAVPLQQQL